MCCNFFTKKKTWHTDNKLISDKAAYHSSSQQDSPRTPWLHKATPGGYINNEMLFRETCICTMCIKYIYRPLYFCAFSKICKTVYIAFSCVTSNGKKLNKQLNEAFYWRKKLKIPGTLVVYNTTLDLKKNVTGRKEKIIMMSGKTKTLSWSVQI